VNLLGPIAAAGFGAGAGATACLLLGSSAGACAGAAVAGGAVAVRVLARPAAARTAGARRAAAGLALLGVLAVAGAVAALRLPPVGSVGALALEFGKVAVLMLGAGLAVVGAILGLIAAAEALRSRRAAPRQDLGV